MALPVDGVVAPADDRMVRATAARATPTEDLQCASCGYGIASARPMLCPICRGAIWEPAPWRPFSGRLRPLL
jgi:hypothetical protein